MLKSIHFKIERYLLINDFSKYKFFDKKIKPLILNFLEDINPRINDRKPIIKIIKDNYLVFRFSMIPLTLVLFGGIVGHGINQEEIKMLSERNRYFAKVSNHFYDMKEIYRRNLVSNNEEIDSLMNYFENREWKEFIIFKEASIRIPKYLPDSVFYIMEEVRVKNRIPNFIYWRLINKESRFRMVENPKSGAYGYMQVMPPTFNEYYEKLGLCGGNNVRNNIEVGAYYLSELYSRFNNECIYSEKKSWELALSSYNAGYTNVIKAGYNIPDFKETKDYVKYILFNNT